MLESMLRGCGETKRSFICINEVAASALRGVCLLKSTGQ